MSIEDAAKLLIDTGFSSKLVETAYEIAVKGYSTDEGKEKLEDLKIDILARLNTLHKS
jgi:hypothetical protein